MSDLRWKQRYQNFERAFEVFERRLSAFRKNRSSEAEQMALVQAFEILVELSWKVAKDYLEYQGFKELKTPRQIIRQAWQSGVLSSAEDWMAALQKRNLASHTYHEATLLEVVDFVDTKFSERVEALRNFLHSEL